MVINPNIETFITKFGWNEDNSSSYVSMLSMINPLGGLCGTFIAKYLIESGRLRAIIIADIVIIGATILVSTFSFHNSGVDFVRKLNSDHDRQIHLRHSLLRFLDCHCP